VWPNPDRASEQNSETRRRSGGGIAASWLPKHECRGRNKALFVLPRNVAGIELLLSEQLQAPRVRVRLVEIEVDATGDQTAVNIDADAVRTVVPIGAWNGMNPTLT